MEELVALGSQSTPTTVVEQGGERTIIIGFDRAKLQEAISKGG